MIKRTDDYSVFSSKELNKIASAIEKAESKKLFDTFDSKKEADVCAAELKVNGFKTEVEETVNGKFKVYTAKLQHVSLNEAEESGQFKKLAWGRYCFQRESGVGELFNYNFNDGTIWKLATDENGAPVLVKEVEEDEEETPVRNPQLAQQTKTAATKRKDVRYTSDVSFKTIANILYDSSFGDAFLHDATPEVKHALYAMFNQKMDKLIISKLAEHGITDDDAVDEIKKLAATALTMEVNSKYTLSKFINSAVKEHLEKVGRQRKYFNK
ncbi:MAG: hypothetical protein K0R18_459 [Bacillales bacterium]|jgi:hypothetical protein|nr:hypothetical protein [Bacillales bacterium]